MKDRKRGDLFERGQELGLTITPVYTVADLMADRHVVERGFFVPVTDPDLGPVRLLREPLVVKPALPRRDPQPAPSLGEHQDDLEQLAPRRHPVSDRTPSPLPLSGLRVLNLGVALWSPKPQSCWLSSARR